LGNRRETRRHRGQRLDRMFQRQRRADRPGRGQPAGQGRHGDDVPRPGADRERTRFGNTKTRGGHHNSVTRV
ncbi:Respiratory nitrate reductase alpha chain (EC 1.7.99.4), partial [Pseudomonas sp. FEN]